MDRGFGRIYMPDQRDESFRMSSILPSSQSTPNYRYWWPNGWWGDQGPTPQCVGYAWAHWLEDGPVTHSAPPPLIPPDALYRDAQRVDEWEGENYDGTSVRAGAKILKARGLIGSYLWAYTIEEVVEALLTRGPVVVGTTWRSGMSQPVEGIIKPTGSIQGGHAYLLNGVNTERGMIRLKNSWGRWWGDRGYAWIAIEDFETLLHDYGEACLATELDSDNIQSTR